MRDNEDWINPAQGEPNDEEMPGSLLFDPNAVPDIEFEGPAAPSGGGLNRIAILLGFVLGVTAVFAMIVVVNRSPDAAGAAVELIPQRRAGRERQSMWPQWRGSGTERPSVG